MTLLEAEPGEPASDPKSEAQPATPDPLVVMRAELDALRAEVKTLATPSAPPAAEKPKDDDDDDDEDEDEDKKS